MKEFAIIKSIVSSIICKTVCIEKGNISPERLNEMSNQYTDDILKEFSKKSKRTHEPDVF